MSLSTRFLRQLDSDHTRRAYRTDLEHFFGTLEASATRDGVVKIRTSHIERWQENMAQEELAASTQRRRMAALRRFFDWLVDQDIVESNPARAHSLQIREESTTEDEDPRCLTKGALQALLRTAGRGSDSAARDQALVLVIVYGALRRSEVASLHVDDVRPLGRHWVIDLPHRGQSRGGYVKIPDLVVEAVQNAVASYQTERGPLWRSFSNRNRGEQMTPDAIYKVIRRIGIQAEVGPIDIDTLRRSGLRLASEAGARFDAIRNHARLSHASSTAKYVCNEAGRNRLGETAADYLDLDLDG